MTEVVDDYQHPRYSVQLILKSSTSLFTSRYNFVIGPREIIFQKTEISNQVSSTTIFFKKYTHIT